SVVVGQVSGWLAAGDHLAAGLRGGVGRHISTAPLGRAGAAGWAWCSRPMMNAASSIAASASVAACQVVPSSAVIFQGAGLAPSNSIVCMIVIYFLGLFAPLFLFRHRRSCGGLGATPGI